MLFRSWDGDRFIFASEIKGILEYVTPVLDKDSVDEFFTFQYTIAPKTLFSGISSVQPGHLIEFSLKEKKLREECYWNLKSGIQQISEDAVIKRLEALIKEAVGLRLVSDVPLGIYLSGGLDSSYIAAVAKELKEEIKAYTVSFNHTSDEAPFTREVAEHLDLDHQEIVVESEGVELMPKLTWHLDAPAANIASLPLYVMAASSKKYLTVALMGDGGDEVFAGYEKYRFMALRDKLSFVPPIITKSLAKSLPFKKEYRLRLNEFLLKDDRSAYLSYISSFNEDERSVLYTDLKARPQAKGLEEYFRVYGPVQGAMAFDLKTLLPNDYLMKVDKTTMASAIEARVPYLDHKLVEFSLTIPPGYKIQHLVTKALFRKVVEKKLPKSITHRKKQGFNVPTSKWLNEGLLEVADNVLDGVPKFLDKQYSKDILHRFKGSPRYFSRQFWSLFSFTLWYRMYFESDRKRLDLNYYLDGGA